MEFEWDPGKARSNERKHAITFEFATGVFDDVDRTERLDNFSAEERWAAVGVVEGIEIYVVYTLRGEVIRLITARRATRMNEKSTGIVRFKRGSEASA
jgi:uncharacterized DUF497 family protein